ncbi:membrane integrity-associated transporter subunit PqiC [Neokomagataea tanensis]|uniref:Membrane integrity-associated transporter subunit PqiC n=1 Tax=Neokomagataea tanensis TaxID=661191 RepID=A0A4Y6V7D5_9PROT|nr:MULTISPECIES: PqiC family protein [Neokomagataea]QDH24407.1 membrane integrity-associated transporter subunit PqiC [Neokomagataea tanensis]
MVYTLKHPFGRMGAFALLCAGLAACSNSSPKLYTLAPENGPVVQVSPSLIEVVTPVISSRLDRDTIVWGDEGYRTKLADGASWSEPLAEMLGHTLASNLAVRLPASRVYAQNDAVTASPTAIVEVTIRNFEADSQGRAYVAGALTAHRRDGTGGSLLQPFQWRSDASVSHSTEKLVSELSHGLAIMSDSLVAQLQSLPPEVGK